MHSISGNRILASVLLLIYFTMIFQHVFLDGLHLVSHTHDLVTNQFKFHSHGNGKFHVHHTHDMVDLVKDVLSGATENEDQSDEVQLQFQFKLHLISHLPGTSISSADIDQKLNTSTLTLHTTILDVLTPPPKGPLIS